MPTNPPSLAARLAAVKDCFLSVAYPCTHPDCCGHAESALECDEPRLTALLAADPPGATVEIVCQCHASRDAHTPDAHPDIVCSEFTPDHARVTSKRALTEEERNR